MADADSAPLIELEVDAQAPILRYDVPEPTSYSGTNLIRLDLSALGEIFKPELSTRARSQEAMALSQQPMEAIKASIRSRVEATAAGGLVVATGPPSGATRPVPDPDDEPTPPRPGVTVPGVVLDALAQNVKDGQRIVVTENPNGDRNVTTVDVPAEPDPALYLVETFTLTSFLGDYGAGRVVKTFSLLPGESTTISVKTFRQRESVSKRAESILDSVTTSSANDFQTAIQQEQSEQAKFEQSKEYYADGTAKAGWSWGSAEVKAGTKGSTNAVREEAVKNVSNATEKHTSKASAKRNIEVNTSAEITEKEGEETSIERTIENINLSRTLNFVFRQMNQQFFTFIHLVDVRVAYFDGARESRIEAPISQLEQLIASVVTPQHLDVVRDAILEQVRSVRDHSGAVVDPLDEVEISPDDTFVQFHTGLVSSHIDPATGREFEIPGVLLKVDRQVMRTEGVIVEAILGEGAALDAYARELQLLEVSRRADEARLVAERAERERLINQAVADNDADRITLLAQIVAASAHTNGDSSGDG